MNVLKYRVSLDMFDTLSQITIKAKKGDSACQIHITLTENGKVYKINDGCYATFNAKKSDGNFIYDKCTIENNTILYDFSSSIDENGVCQVSALEGNVDCEVTLYNANGEQLTSPRFILYIDGTVYDGEEIISTPSADVLKSLITEAKNTINEVETKLENGDFVGERGEAFTYEDFTEEQLASLKGEKGDKGDKGDTGNITNLDQTYNPESENAQSGKAVAEAIKRDKILGYITYEFVSNGNDNDGTITITDCDTNIMGDFEIPSNMVISRELDNTQGGTYIHTWSYPITVIGDNAFAECKHLTNIRIPNVVTTIDNNAFGSCYGLKNIAIPDSVITIGNSAFGSCYSLKNVSLGNSVTTIGDGAFASYSGLTNITIPVSVANIGNGAFKGNTITDVYYKGTKEQWDAIEIGENNDWINTATIHYNQELATEDYVNKQIANIEVEVDQTYNPTSENAQSGKAVNEAVKIENNYANNTFANALKSTVMGNPVIIDDVSPITHDLKVKLTGIEDYSGVTVSRVGKNLFDISNIITSERLSIKDDRSFCVVGVPVCGLGTLKSLCPNLRVGDIFTISFNTTSSIKQAYSWANVYMNSGTSHVATQVMLDNYIGFYGNDNGAVISDLQIEIGNTKTEYEPYFDVQRQTITANKDGTVEGFTSLYPTTVLVSDNNGVTIKCEYNKDIVKGFAELTKLILNS